MTIAELRKIYPNERKWFAFKFGSYPSWDYDDDDIVTRYEAKEKEYTEIKDPFGDKTKAKKIKETVVYVYWERKQKEGK